MTKAEEERQQQSFNRKADKVAGGCLEWGCLGWPFLLALPFVPFFLLVR